MAKLDSLIVDLQLNSAALRSGLESATGVLADFGKGIANIDKQLHSLGEAKSFEIGKEAVRGLAEFVQKGAEAAAQMGILANSAGVPVESFSRLSYAANMSGVSTEDLAGVFNKLNKNLGLAGAGVPANVALFKSLGVSLRDSAGHAKNSSVIMGELATKFSGLQQGFSKSALEMEVFGKTGAALDTMLAQGAEGLAKLGAEADAFGITTGPEAAEAAHKFEQNLTKLQLAGGAVGKQVAVELAPALTRLTDDFLSSKTGAETLREAVTVVKTAIQLLASGVIIAAAAFEGFGTYIGLTAAKLSALANGDLKEVQRANAELAASLKATGEHMKQGLRDVWNSDHATEEQKKIETGAKGSADAIQKSFEDSKKAITESDTAIKKLTATLAQWESKVAEEGQSPMQALFAQLSTGTMVEEFKKAGAAAQGLFEKLQKVGAELVHIAAIKLGDQLAFELAKANATTAETISTRSRDFENIGRPIEEQDKTRGFASFDAALKEYSQQTAAATSFAAVSALELADKNYKASQAALLGADAAKLGADHALQAADAFKASKERLLAADKIAFELGRTGSSIDRDVAKRRIDFANIGKSIGEEDRTRGFADFNAALASYATQTNLNAKLVADAQLAQIRGDIIGAQNATLLADAAKNAADQASTAADAFRASKEAMQATLEGMINGLASKMGAVGDVIQAGISGFKSGGFIGAIVGVIGAIVAKLEGFTHVVESMNAFFGRWIESVNKAISPLFDGLIRFAEAIGSIAEVLENVTFVFEGIYMVTFVVGKILDAIAIGLLMVAKIFADMAGGSKTINDQLKKAQDDIAKGYHQVDATATAATTDSVSKLGDAAAKAADKFGELNTNLPSGYKLGAALFKADAGIGGWYGSDTSGTAGNQGPTGDRNDPIYVTTFDPVTGGTHTTGASGTTTYNPTTGNTSNQADANDNQESTRLTAEQIAAYNAKQAQDAQDQRDQHAERDAEQQRVGPTIHIENVHIAARNFSEFVKQITEAQETQAGQLRRNPFKAP